MNLPNKLTLSRGLHLAGPPGGDDPALIAGHHPQAADRELPYNDDEQYE